MGNGQDEKKGNYILIRDHTRRALKYLKAYFDLSSYDEVIRYLILTHPYIHPDIKERITEFLFPQPVKEK